MPSALRLKCIRPKVTAVEAWRARKGACSIGACGTKSKDPKVIEPLQIGEVESAGDDVAEAVPRASRFPTDGAN